MHASIDTVFIADTKMTDAQRTQRRFDYSAAPPTQRCFFSKIRKGFIIKIEASPEQSQSRQRRRRRRRHRH